MSGTSRQPLPERVASVAPQTWGGFLMTARREHVMQITLTGRLSAHTVDQIDEKIAHRGRSETTTFLLLDATHLEHVPVSVLDSLHDRESEWRESNVVTLWFGLSPYLANLFVLAWWGEDMPPVFSDLSSALDAVESVDEFPSGTARGRLLAWGAIGP